MFYLIFINLDFKFLIYLFILTPSILIPRIITNFSINNDKSGPLNMVNQIVKNKGPILILGGAGYIGSVLSEELLKKGHKVRVLDKLLFGDHSILYLKNKYKNFEFLEGDISNINSLINATQNVSQIIHLAGLVGDPACSFDEKFTKFQNIKITNMIIDIANAQKISNIIFASSCSVYGIAEEKVNEESPTNPISLYAKSKLISEQELISKKNYTNSIILRFATVFGHSYRPRFDLVANLFTKKVFEGEEISLINPNQWRPLISVKNLSEAITYFAENYHKIDSGEIFNIGSSEMNYTIGDIYETAIKIQKNFSSHNYENKVNINDNISDFRNYSVDFSKFERLMTFSEIIDLEKGMTEIFLISKMGITKILMRKSF